MADKGEDEEGGSLSVPADCVVKSAGWPFSEAPPRNSMEMLGNTVVSCDIKRSDASQCECELTTEQPLVEEGSGAHDEGKGGDLKLR